MHDVILGCETICRTLNLHDSISVAGTLKINCTLKNCICILKFWNKLKNSDWKLVH